MLVEGATRFHLQDFRKSRTFQFTTDESTSFGNNEYVVHLENGTTLKTLLKLQLLAQANAAPPVEPTAGQMLSGLMVLFVMAASIWMIVVWF